MAAIKRQFIQHTFAGGWATAFGPFAPVAPDENNTVKIPFLSEAKNVLFELDGGPHKSPGTVKLNSSAVTGTTNIRGIFDYWKQGTGGSPTQKRVVHSGTEIYKDDADGSFASLTGAIADLSTTAVPNYETFDDLLIIASDATSVADIPYSWDQSTFQALAGSPPNFAFSVRHKNALFASGVEANPSRLYFSDNLNPEVWSGGTSGSIDIDPNDGDHITGIISHRDELIVFKGPYKGSIHRISGSVFGGSTSDIARKSFISGVGAVWQNGIFHLGDDVAFWWSDGTLRTLSATAAFGDFREASLTAEIQDYLDVHLTFSALRTIQVSVDSTGRRVFCALPTDTVTTPNKIFVFDFRFNPGRWSLLEGYNAKSLALVQDSSIPILFFGGDDGFIRKFNQVSRTNDESSIAMNVKTPYLSYGVPHQSKTIEGASLGAEPKSTASITFGWKNDRATQQTETFSFTGGFILNSTTLGVLDTDTLGGAFFQEVYRQLETGGEFRTIQYEISNNADGIDVEIHSFSTVIHLDGESMEN